MRPTLIAGLLVSCLGVFLLVRGGTFTTRDELLKVGDLKVTTTDTKSIPGWVGGVVLVVGIGMVVAGASKRS